MESEKLKLYRYKLLISDLILDVLNGKISVQSALLKFPKDIENVEIKCAFDAIMYLEADEDIRKKDKEYRELQNEYLLHIAKIFKENGNLAQNIISRYLKYNKDDLISKKRRTLKDTLNYLKRMINF